MSAVRDKWFWGIVTLLIACIPCFPVVDVLLHIGKDSDGTWQHLSETVLFGYLTNTLILAVSVSALTLIIGVGGAWLVTMCDFPGRKCLSVSLLLPLAIPTYITAYAAADLLQFAGPVQTFLRDTFSWTKGDYWFPEVRSLYGAICVLSFGLYPYVYLAGRAAFQDQPKDIFDSVKVLGHGPWSGFYRISLPMAWPAIAAGMLLVVMETLAEFGAVEYCAVDTFSTGIYRTWMSHGSVTAAAQLSACLIGIVLIFQLCDSLLRGRKRFHSLRTIRKSGPIYRLTGSKAIAAVILTSFPVVFGFLLPLLVFAHKTLTHGDQRTIELVTTFGKNSLIVGVIASTVAVILAFASVYAVRLRPSPISQFANKVSGLGYSIPGSVIAVGCLAPFFWFEELVQSVSIFAFDYDPGFWITGTILALILGYQCRFLAISLGFISAGITRVPLSLDQASRSLGNGSLMTLFRVHYPLLKPTLIYTGILVFVDILKELPITLILQPFNFQTLAVRVHQLASDERLEEASTGVLAIITAGLISVIFLTRFTDRSHR